MAASLRNHWGPVFAPRPVSRRHLNAYLDKHVKRFDVSDVAPPTVHSIARAIKRAKPTAPGPDGLPMLRGSRVRCRRKLRMGS
eukprot:5212575-Pyramimonas_sp.AAC.1